MTRYYVESPKYQTAWFTPDQIKRACKQAVDTDGTVYAICDDGVTRRYAGRHWEAALDAKYHQAEPIWYDMNEAQAKA